MNTLAPKDSKPPKAVRRRSALRGRRCPRCPFCSPSGACLDPRLKSGRCGDWVFQVVRGKQQRHLFKKPQDPRTPSQLRCRGRLTAASRKYSHELTEEQLDACIAAGAKRRSRPRLGQSGPLTGQQWWVRSQCAEKSEGRMQNAETAAEGLQTKGILTPTWDPRRSASVAPPEQHRKSTRRTSPGGSKSESRSPKPERRPKAETPKAPTRPGARVSANGGFGLRTSFGLRPSGFGLAAPAPRRSIPSLPRWPRPRGCSCRSQARTVEADWRRRRWAAQQERGPPEQTPCDTDDGDRALVGCDERC